MKKGYVVGLSVCAILLGTCSLPFLPISGHVFLKNYEQAVRLGPYDIEARILLFENRDKRDMRISGYFTYPAKEMIEDNCFFEVRANLEGQTLQEYPAHVVGTEYEKNFPIETISDSSINSDFRGREYGRLILTLYNEPIVEQTYTLSLQPFSSENKDICIGTKIIKHRIRRYRASPFSIAMGV